MRAKSAYSIRIKANQMNFKAIPIVFFIRIFSGSGTEAASLTDTPDTVDSNKIVQFSVSEFLSTAFHAPSLVLQDERILALKAGPKGVSFVEDPELRISIDKFENHEQKYALRLKPRGWGEIKGEKAVQRALVELGAIERDTLLHNALKERYLTTVDVLYVSKIRSLHEALNLLLKDWEHVLKRHVDTPDFNAGELAEIENQRMALTLDIVELENLQNDLAEKIAVQSGHAEGAMISFTTEAGMEIISVDQLWDRLLTLHIDMGSDNIYLNQAKAEVARAEARYQLERAEKRHLISFVETTFDTSDGTDFEDAFSVEFGISIPLGSSNQNTLWKRKLERMKCRSSQQFIEHQLALKLPVIQQKIHSLIEQHTAVLKTQANSFSKVAFDNLLQADGTDPLTLLKLKRGSLKTEILIAKLARMIFTTYIELLDISGKLSEKPVMNYLSPRDNERLRR